MLRLTIRKLLLIGAAGMVALVAAVIIVWWFAIREDAELATSPPEIPTDLIQATNEPPPAGYTALDALSFPLLA